ncbi:sulfite exporter TauE/SafE family protein [Roseiarcus sp.]|uniref:sulfite exporter TauE/SafE family protein n=1 Tax=Roseiarcus sp. TaxID=1969460 RepID=UPI003F957991
MGIDGLFAGAAVGLVGGFTSGLLGVSPGGGLVVFSVLLLGAEQHVAQGISLAAQIPPPRLAGIRRYHEAGVRTPARWFVPLAIGFLIGGIGGARAASFVSAAALQWTYVAYLIGLDALLLRRDPDAADDDGGGAIHELRWGAMLAVGLFAGLSSGFLGIGGGLTTTVGLSAVLGVPQRQAQMASLVLSLLPTTIPAAWVYWRAGAMGLWPALLGVILGLTVGADIGARLATRLDRRALRPTLFAFVSAMAVYMARQAWVAS